MKNKFSTAISVRMLEDSVYQFTLTVPNFTSIDKVYAEYQAIFQKEDGQSIVSRLGDTSDGQNVWLVMSRPDINYVPENPRLTDDEKDYMHWQKLYFKPGNEAKTDEAFRKYKAIERTITVNYNKIISGKQPELNIPLQPGDTIGCMHVHCAQDCLLLQRKHGLSRLLQFS